MGMRRDMSETHDIHKRSFEISMPDWLDDIVTFLDGRN